MQSTNEFKDDFVADDFTPDSPKDDFVADDFTPDQPAKKKRTLLDKSARIASQYALGRAQSTPVGIVYDVATLPLNTEGYFVNAIQERVGEDLEDLYTKKASGNWTEQDEKYLQAFKEQLKNPGKIAEQAKELKTDISIRGLAEKATGVDLHPEGVLEKTANWAGWIKNPANVTNLKSWGTNPKEIAKSILPYPNEVLRGIGAGTAWEMAEQGQFGPIGTLGAMIVGDMIGHTPKMLLNIAKNPKQSAAEFVNFVTMNNSKRQAATQLAEDFAKSNLKIDAGTLTGSPLVQMIQTRLSQSGLTGTALDNLRKELSEQIVKEYKNIVEDVGELTFENSHQAAEAVKRALRGEVASYVPKQQAANAPSLQGRVQTIERPNYQQELLDRIAPEETRNSYQGGENLKTAAEDIKAPIKEEFNQRWENLNGNIRLLPAEPQAQLAAELSRFLSEHRGSLLLGESAAEAGVIRTVQRLLRRLQRNGALIGVRPDELVKTRRTLGDIANWEMAGSDFESAYKKLVGDLNSAIDRSIGNNPELRNQYLHLNADYEAYKTLFENENLEKLYNPKNHNYNSIYKDFANNPDKLRSLEDVFYASERGQELVNQIKRDYAQSVIERPNLTAREIRDLQNVLGPQYDSDILNFIARRQESLEHPLPQIQPQEPLGITAPVPQTKASQQLNPSRISETGTEAAKANLRKKFLKELEGKSSDQILKEMDTIDGIRRMRRALTTTEEGKQLFKELSRYKLAELIDKKMLEGTTEQVKLGKFSNLLETKKSRDIVKELLTNDAYERLVLLQKNSGKLAQASGKFFNASQSGIALTDVGLVGAAASGIMLGNPFMAMPALMKIGGSYVVAKLMADPIFLKELEKAIRAPTTKKFNLVLKEMKPIVNAALRETQERNQKE